MGDPSEDYLGDATITGSSASRLIRIVQRRNPVQAMGAGLGGAFATPASRAISTNLVGYSLPL